MFSGYCVLFVYYVLCLVIRFLSLLHCLPPPCCSLLVQSATHCIIVISQPIFLLFSLKQITFPAYLSSITTLSTAAYRIKTVQSKLSKTYIAPKEIPRHALIPVIFFTYIYGIRKSKKKSRQKLSTHRLAGITQSCWRAVDASKLNIWIILCQPCVLSIGCIILYQ